jgi:16S rRNA processing protein RimM
LVRLEAEGSLRNAVTTETSWVAVARIVRPQGRRGELLAEVLTDFPDSFAQRKRLFLRPTAGKSKNEIRQTELEAFWHHKGRVVLKFAGVDSINDAERLRGFDVLIPLAERMPLIDDAVYVSDLLGARVVDISNGIAADAGEIVDVVPEDVGPAMLVLRTEAAEPVLIPFVKAYLRRVDLEAKRIEMALPEGLLTVDAPLTLEERQRMQEETGKGD